MRVEHIRSLQSAFEEAAARLMPEEESVPELEIDSEVQFNQIDSRLMDELEHLEPFGMDNPPPVFLARDVQVASAAIVGQRHRRMSLCQSQTSCLQVDAIHFNLAQDSPRATSFEQLAFRLQWNRYRGEKRIQLVIEDR